MAFLYNLDVAKLTASNSGLCDNAKDEYCKVVNALLIFKWLH